MGRFFLSLIGIVTIAALAGGATAAPSIVGKHPLTLVRATLHTPSAPSSKPVAYSPKPVQSQPAAAPTPANTPTTTPASSSTAVQPATPTTLTTPTATINGYVHMRATASTSSAIVTDLYAGDVVSYTSQDTGEWQAVTYQGQAGYVYKSYINY